MKLKKKNILVIAILAVAGLFGTASAVVNQKVNEEPVVEKAEASAETEYNQTLQIGHNNGNGGTDSGWKTQNFTHVAGPFQALYNFTFKQNTQFYFKYGSSTYMKNSSNYINSPANFGNYGGNNLYYWGSEFVADIVINVRSQKYYIVSAQGHRTLTIKSNSTYNYLHFWCSDYSNENNLSTKWEGVSFNKSGKTIDFPNCFNKFILNGGSTQTGTLDLSTISGETGTVAGTGNSATVSWLNQSDPYFLGTPNNWAVSNSYKFTSYSGNFKKLSGVSIASGQDFKVLYGNVWYGGDFGYINNEGSAFFTINHNGNNDNIHCNTGGTYDIVFNTSSHYIYIYLSVLPSGGAGYYLIGSGEFGDWSLRNAIPMTDDPSGTNAAILESETGFEISEESVFKVIHYDGIANVIYYNINTAGGTYDGDDWDFNYNSEGNAHYDGSGSSFNFYLLSVAGGSSDGNTNVTGTANFHIVDVGEVDKFGMLFIASNQNASTLRITSKEGASTTVLNNVLLSSVVGFHEYTRVTGFNGYSHLYVVPVFNLRGADTGKLVDRVIINDTTRTVTGLPTTKGASITYYYGSTGAASTAGGKAGLAVTTIDEYIYATTNHSVCELTKDNAGTLDTLYKAATSASTTLHQTATINTYTSTLDAGTKGDVLVSSIYTQISAIASTGKPIGQAVHSFSPLSLFGDSEDGLSTIIIIAASSVALLSVTALSILVIKKRKNKEE